MVDVINRAKTLKVRIKEYSLSSYPNDIEHIEDLDKTVVPIYSYIAILSAIDAESQNPQTISGFPSVEFVKNLFYSFNQWKFPELPDGDWNPSFDGTRKF